MIMLSKCYKIHHDHNMLSNILCETSVDNFSSVELHAAGPPTCCSGFSVVEPITNVDALSVPVTIDSESATGNCLFSPSITASVEIPSATADSSPIKTAHGYAYIWSYHDKEKSCIYCGKI